jgi:hypothetical protein
LATQTVDAAALADNSFWSFTFPPIKQAKGRTFYFFVESNDALPGEAATLWYAEGDPYEGGTRTQNGSAATGDLVFRTLAPASEGEQWFALALDGGPAGASVYENLRALPRAWLVHEVEVQPDRQARLQRLGDPGFDPGRTAVLNAPLPPGADLPAGSTFLPRGEARITTYLPERVEIAADSEQPAILVMSDLAFPGWEATVDGAPAPLLTVNHALRGVFLPAGAHTVRFDYRPMSFTAGVAISLLTLLLIIALSIRRPVAPDV